MRHSRRSFLKTSAALTPGALTFPGLAGAFDNVDSGQSSPRVNDLVQFSGDIEPLVRIIEETTRGAVFKKVAEKIRGGVTYNQLMAALYLAGIRNLATSPGGALHAVFAIQSAHQIGQNSGTHEKLLPMFWALDNFKLSQARITEPAPMQKFRHRTPSAEKSVTEFRSAMDEFDADRIEAAVVGLLRANRPEQVFEELWWHGARDYRSIGHKAIYVMQAWRTLQNIGWQHAEPALRHVARSLVTYGKDKAVNGFNMVGQCYAGNLVRLRGAVKKLPRDWDTASDRPQIVNELVPLIRSADHEAACQFALDLLLKGTATAQPIWDAVHLIAGEIVIKRTSIRPIHAVTSANALHYAFNQSNVPGTKLFLTLQAVGWMCHFMKYMRLGTDTLADKQIERIEPADIPDTPTEAIEAVLTKLAGDRPTAARMAYSLVQKHSFEDYVKAARLLVLTKARESHQWKFPAAAFEDVQLISPRWRPHFIAAATCYLSSSRASDSATTKNARKVLS